MIKKKPGRPTKYNKDLLRKAQAYYNQCAGSEEMPFIERLSMIIDVNDDTINEWVKSEVNEEFSATVKKIKQLQKLRLQELGLKGGRQQIFSIFLLKTNHRFIETDKHINQEEKIHIELFDGGYTPKVKEIPKQQGDTTNPAVTYSKKKEIPS